MEKVYIVTSGEYSDYGINRVFSSMEAAEKYCALWDCKYENPRIEEYDLDNGSNMQCTVYRAIYFAHRDGVDFSRCRYEIRRSTEPFDLDIQESVVPSTGRVKGIQGCIPIAKNIEDCKVIRKIIADNVAKWKAEQSGV